MILNLLAGSSPEIIGDLSNSLPAALIMTFWPRLSNLSKRYPRTKKVLTAFVTVAFLVRFVPDQATKVWDWTMTHALASVKVESPSTLHDNVTDSISQVRVIHLQRHLTAPKSDIANFNSYSKDNNADVPSRSSARPNLLFDGDRSWQMFDYEGHRFFYMREIEGSLKICQLSWSTKQIREMLTQTNGTAKKTKRIRAMKLRMEEDARTAMSDQAPMCIPGSFI